MPVFSRQCDNCGAMTTRTSRSEAMRPSWRFCSLSCRTSHLNRGNTLNRGKTLPLAVRLKISASKLGKPNLKLRRSIRGSKHWNWQGGKTKTSRRLRYHAKYKAWRKAVFERDLYQCQLCGDFSHEHHPVVLNADHIKPWATFPALRYSLSNGRTLCLTCHRATDTFGYKTSTARP